MVSGSFGRSAKTKKGLKQGRTQSMDDFTLVLAFALEELLQDWQRRRCGILIGTQLYNILAFADDIILVCRNLSEAMVMVKELQTAIPKT